MKLKDILLYTASAFIVGYTVFSIYQNFQKVDPVIECKMIEKENSQKLDDIISRLDSWGIILDETEE